MNARWLEGLDVAVTGATGGLGGAVLDALLEAGATCHVAMRRSTSSTARDRVHVSTGVDLAVESDVEDFYARCPPLWASVHLAGGFAAAPIVETTLSMLRAQLDVNLTTAFLCSRAAVRRIRAATHRAGRIVNVTSRAALIPSGGTIAYSASKAAVSMLTLSLAEELRGSGILVNAVAPAIIDTPANREAMPDADFRQWTAPEDIARTIVWLGSPENRSTTGAIVPV